jgi:hypothetical protein
MASYIYIYIYDKLKIDQMQIINHDISSLRPKCTLIIYICRVGGRGSSM